jgi:hypothetical protein
MVGLFMIELSSALLERLVRFYPYLAISSGAQVVFRSFPISYISLTSFQGLVRRYYPIDCLPRHFAVKRFCSRSCHIWKLLSACFLAMVSANRSRAAKSSRVGTPLQRIGSSTSTFRFGIIPARASTALPPHPYEPTTDR